MHVTGRTFLNRWHRIMGMSHQRSRSWHRDRLREEVQEFRKARTWRQKLSEASDVFFTSSRAQYDGFPVRRLPSHLSAYNILIYTYMLAKFTSRWQFYRTVAFLCKAPHYKAVREVVNPSNDAKLKEVALRHQMDPLEFQRVACRLRRLWPLFP